MKQVTQIQTPAEFTWTVDNIPPETEITSVKDGQGTELFNRIIQYQLKYLYPSQDLMP